MRLFRFDLVRPCPGCPFTPKGYKLGGERMAGICDALERKTFPCHDTVLRDQPRDARGRFRPKPVSHCAGALIIMARENLWGDMQQLAIRLGLLRPERLDLKAETYPTLEAAAEAHGGSLRWIGVRHRRPHARTGRIDPS